MRSSPRTSSQRPMSSARRSSPAVVIAIASERFEHPFVGIRSHETGAIARSRRPEDRLPSRLAAVIAAEHPSGPRTPSASPTRAGGGSGGGPR